MYHEKIVDAVLIDGPEETMAYIVNDFRRMGCSLSTLEQMRLRHHVRDVYEELFDSSRRSNGTDPTQEAQMRFMLDNYGFDPDTNEIRRMLSRRGLTLGEYVKMLQEETHMP